MFITVAQYYVYLTFVFFKHPYSSCAIDIGIKSVLIDRLIDVFKVIDFGASRNLRLPI